MNSRSETCSSVAFVVGAGPGMVLRGARLLRLRPKITSIPRCTCEGSGLRWNTTACGTSSRRLTPARGTSSRGLTPARRRQQVLQLYRQTLRAARRCPEDERRREVEFYARHKIEANQHVYPDQAASLLKQGQDDLARFVYLLDLKQGKLDASHDDCSGNEEAGSCTGASADAGQTAGPVGSYDNVQRVLALAKASHHLPRFEDAEITDDLLSLVGEGVLTMGQFEDMLREAEVPVGPRMAIMACVERVILSGEA